MSASKTDGSTSFDPAVDAEWLHRVRDNLYQEDYFITRQQDTDHTSGPPVYQATNRLQNLQSVFSRNGVLIQSQATKLSAWRTGLILEKMGRNGKFHPLPGPAAAHADNNRIEFDRGMVIEWYENRSVGIEQGFTIHEKPVGNGPLVLELTAKGNTKPVLSQEKDAVHFVNTAGKTVLTYSKLYVFDAQERSLPSKFKIHGSRLEIIVDDANAIYPIIIDPLFAAPEWSWDNPATAVSTAGDVNGDGYSDVIIGEWDYSTGGGVFLFYGSATGLGTTPDWQDETDVADAWFGYSVACAGDINGDGYSDVIVGSPYHDDGEDNEGKVFAYYGSNSGLSLTPDWSAESNEAWANFGHAVAMAGDVDGNGYGDIIIGAPGNEYHPTGDVYVYLGSASGLGASGTPANADWTAAATQTIAPRFGVSVATAGDVNGDGYSDIIVGSPYYEDDDTYVNEGRAFAYYGSASGLGDAGTPANADWSNGYNITGFLFGGSVNTAGDVNGDGYSDVIVGATGYDFSTITSVGLAMVYLGSGSGISTSYHQYYRGTAELDLIGSSVGTAGDVNGDGYADIIVGSKQNNTIYVLKGSTDGLPSTGEISTQADWSISKAFSFGGTVATAGDIDGDGMSDIIAGGDQAFVYAGSFPELEANASQTIDGGETYRNLSKAMNPAGDVNGDGFMDVIVGDYGYGASEGIVYVYHGSAGGVNTTTPDWTNVGNEMSDRLGYWVNTAGDVNGDGYGDIIIGAPGYGDYGAALIYYGSSSGIAGTPDIVQGDANQGEVCFGEVVASAGDVNGDGYDDVLVSAPIYDFDGGREGAVFLYLGSSQGLVQTPAWDVFAGAGSNRYGTAIGFAGDVNSDGYDDFFVTGRLNGVQGIFVYHGDPQGPSEIASWTAADTIYAAAKAGDVNNDGFGDIVIGDSSYSDSTGRIAVFNGSSTGLDLNGSRPVGSFANADWVLNGSVAGGRLGISVNSAGDANRDGYGDIIAGESFWFETGISGGRAHIFYGSSSGITSNGPWQYECPQVDAVFGQVVFSPGDINADGFSDIVIGARNYTESFTQEGRILFFFGNDGGDSSMPLPEQFETDGVTPIKKQEMSDSETEFVFSTTGLTPFGRGLVKVEWEAKPAGQPFDGTNTVVSDIWQDSGTTGYLFNEQIAGLIGHTPYRWRVRFHYQPGNPMGIRYSSWQLPFAEGHYYLKTNNTAPFGGYDSNNILPTGQGQITQSTSLATSGVMTIHFRLKDAGINDCTLHTFEYSVNGGSSWKKPTNTDASNSLDNGWPDNSASGYSAAVDWSEDVHTFTFNTKHGDVSADFLGIDQSDIRIRFTINDGLVDSALPLTSDNFRVDGAPPATGTILINDIAGTTNDATPPLSLASNGADFMRFAATEGGLSAASWVSFNTSYSGFDISPGGNGPKTIWVEFRDQYWNIQTTHTSDSTIYDTSPVVTGEATTNDTTPTWAWSSGGDGTGLFRYKLDDSDLETGATETTGTSYTPSQVLSQGEHTLYIQEENMVSYWGATASMTIDIDSGAPCSEASSPGTVDDQNKTFTIDYAYDDIYAGETCSIASSGTGLGTVELYAKAPGETSYSLVDTDSEGSIDGMFEYTATDEGAYHFYTIATDNAGNIEALPASGYDSETVYASEFAGYAILSVGSISGEEGLESHTLTANDVYKHLINRHFALADDPQGQWADPLDHIKYFNPYGVLQTGEDDFSEGGSIDYWTAMQKTITQWALNKMTLLPGPLYLVLIDHGTPDRFNLTGTMYFTAQELDNWLDTLETGLSQNGIAPQDIVIVLGTCYSGSFIDDISGPNRIIVTSTADDEPSYRGGLEPGGVRDGEFFVSNLFNNLALGLDLKTSFQQASLLTGLHTDSGLINSPAPYFDTALQHPLLDDDGDFAGSHDLSNEGDGVIAETVFLGVGTQAPDPLVVSDAGVSPDAPVPSDEHSALIWAKVSDIGQAETVWVEVRDPDTELAGGTEQQTIDLWEAELTLNNDQYEVTYNGFWDPGQYTLFFYVKDVNGIVSPFYVAYAHKALDGNTAPGTFDLIDPADGHATTTSAGLGATWEASVDPDGDSVTYTLEIRHDPLDSRWGAETFFFRQQGLTGNFIIIGEEAEFLDLRSFLWKVITVDKYGLETASNQERGLDIDNNNPLAGWIKGLVYDTVTNNPIAHAQVTASGLAISLTGTGYYLGFGPAGTFNITISATGYGTTVSQEVGVPEGGTVHHDFGLSPASGDTEPVATIISPDSAFTIDAGDSIYFEGSVIGGNVPLSFTWDFDGGAANVSVEDPESVTFATVGTYTITFTVTDDDGDTDSDFVVVTVEDGGTVDPVIPELVSPGDNQTQVSLTPHLQAGSFAATLLNGTHARTLWQISASNAFDGGLVADVDTQTNLTRLTLPELMLDPDTTYYWRANFINNTGQESGWSTPFAFTTTDSPPDGDGDGVPDAQEVADGVDLDHDGTNDNVQLGMLSVQTAVGNGQIGIKDTADATVTALSAIDPASITDPFNRPSDLPLGLVSFKISVTQGATVTFPVLLSAPAPADARWYKYDTVNGWLDYTSKAVFSSDRMTVTLTLTDGGDGDGDFTANGIIIDPSGLAKTAIVQPPPQDDGTSGGGGGGGGCFIQTAESNELAFWVMLGLLVSLSLMIAMFFHGRSQS